LRKRDKPPAPMVRKTGGTLSPVTAWDAEELASFPNGAEFDLVLRTKRSIPQHRAYWQALTRAVDATGRWESREALHTALKVRMGLVEPLMGLDGEIICMIPHSTAFAAMDQREFREYFDRAMAVLSEAVGFDVLDFLND
jgi:hypothetical protein